MTKQRILIDGFNMGLETGTGVATYARNLCYCAHDLGYDVNVLYGNREAPGFHSLLREIAFFDSAAGDTPAWVTALRYAAEVFRFGPGPRAKEVPMTGRVITDTFKSRLPYFDHMWNSPDIFGKAQRRFDIYQLFYPSRMTVSLPKTSPNIAHWTYPLPIRIRGAKNIYTFHDLVPLRLPYTTLDNKRRYFKLVRILAKNADHIVTVSETSKKDIQNLLGVPERKITNTYQAVEIPEKYAKKPADVVRREVEGTFNVDYKNYFLFFGAIEPKKNVGRLIEGYLGSKVDTPLVIVGKLAWKSSQEMRLLNEDATSYLEQVGSLTFRRRRIFHIDYAPFPLLVSLIKGAKAVLFPSLYEGFGLPALEAMSLGTPVLTSAGGALGEVTADAALGVDPYDTRAIAEGISALDSNKELRDKFSELGVKRAALFSTKAYQDRLADLYKSL